MRKFLNILKYTLLSVLALIVIIPASLYIPFVQTFICEKVVSYLNDTNNEMVFGVEKIRIGFPLKLQVYGVTAHDKRSGNLLFGLGKLQAGLDDIPIGKDYFLVEKFQVENVELAFDTLTQSLSLKGKIENLNVSNLFIDPINGEVSIDDIIITHPEVAVAIGPSEPDTVVSETNFDWRINLDRVLAVRGDVKFDMSDVSLSHAVDSVELSKYFDYNHLLFTDMSLGISRFSYYQDMVACNVANLHGTEQNSGLEFERFQTNFLMKGDSISARNIDFEMPLSRIDGDVALNLHLLYALLPDSVEVDSIELRKGFLETDLNLKISSKDLITLGAYYVPAMDGNWPDEDTRFSLRSRVTADSLDLAELALKIPYHTDFKIEGFGYKPFLEEERQINATIKGDLIDADFLLSTFVEPSRSRSYFLPRDLFVELDAGLKQRMISADFLVKQAGHIVAQGFGKHDLASERYSLNAMTNKLRLSEFVPSTGIYGISTRIKANGQHFLFPNKYTRFEVDAELDTLYYNNGRGERDSLFDVSVNASLLKNHYYAQLTSGHPYVMLDTQLQGEYAKDKVSVQGYVDLQKLDLMHLPQIVAADLGDISMQSDIMGSYDYGDNAFADILIHSLTYDDGERINPFDEIDLRFESSKGYLEASFESGDARIDINADKSIRGITTSIDSVLAEVNRQVDRISIDIPAIQRHLPHLNADLELSRNNSFYPLATMLGYQFRQAKATLRNDTTFRLQARLLGLTTETTRIDTIQMRLMPEHDHNIYDYKWHVNYAAPKASDSYEVNGGGQIFRDSIQTFMNYENGKYITMYDVNASVALADDTVRLHFNNNPVIYAQPFIVNDDNFIQVSGFKDLAAQNLGIDANLDLDGKNDLCVNLETHKNEDAVGNVVKLLLNNLDLNYLSNTLELGVDVGGNLNAECFVKLQPSSLLGIVNTDVTTFHIGDYKADTLLFKGITLDDAGQMDVAGKFTIDNLVKLDLVANIYDSVAVDLGIYDLPMQLINGFMPSNIQLSGEATGALTVKGKDFENPAVNGFLTMNGASANYADADATIHFPNDTIRLRRNRLRFRDYKLTGSNKNPVVLAGSIDFSEALAEPTLNLTLRGEKAQIFRNTKRRNKMQYICGTLPATVDMTIKGKLSDLDVRGSVSALEGTNLIYYLEDDPLTSASKVDELVDFVSFRELDRIVEDAVFRPLRVSQKEEGVEVDMKINIANNAKVYVHLPTNDKDHVSLVGGGSLNLICNPDGTMYMSGMYDITGGDVFYKLPMIPVSKDFDLDERSWITWNGPVEDPVINLVAVDQVRSTVNDQSGSRVVNFDVIINISGTLNGLDIAFSCDAPEDGVIASEIATLTDEERSKQALLLLIAQTYMGPGNTSSMGLASANAALNSLLNKQVESLVTNKLKYTDINLGIDTYDADGATRTDYSVKVSQRLFNDRMRVTIGGKISQGEGTDESQKEAMINDVSLEYLTKKDGSSFARLFRKTNYQNILEGEIVETGLGYVQQRSAFRFRNLFIPSSKKSQAALNEQIRLMQQAEQEAERAQRRRNINNNDSIQKKDTMGISPVVTDSLSARIVQLDK